VTYALGDPAHINLGHNELVAAIQEQADLMGITVTLPDTAGLGDTGHTDDHNLIVTALQTIADEATVFATISGTTGSPATGTGKDGRPMYTWTSNGSFTVSVAGLVRILCVSGGGGASSAPASGGGGQVDDFTVYLEPGTYTVTVGAAGTWPSGLGGASKVISSGLLNLWSVNLYPFDKGDGGRSANLAGVYSDISGSSVGYGGAGQRTGPTGYDSAFGGEPGSGLPRANSGGGGSPTGTAGSGAAGIVKLLA
jgi:hypothetical protein